MPSTKCKPSGLVKETILRAVRESPGVTTKGICSEVPVTQSTVSMATRALIADGRITRKLVSGAYHYYPSGAEATRTEHIDPKVEPQQLFLSNAPLLEAEIEALKAEIDTLEDEIDTLEAEVAELRAFKERAISQYAELDVEPIILEARKIAYLAFLDVNDRNNADCALYGNADDTPMLKAIVETLRRVKGAE